MVLLLVWVLLLLLLQRDVLPLWVQGLGMRYVARLGGVRERRGRRGV